MSKSKKTCTQNSCPAYQDAMRTLSKSGQSAQVLYIEPNFMATPSECDVFYDCFSSESDYPSERCNHKSLLYPKYGDNLRNSLEKVAYTARVLLKSFNSSHNHRHYKPIKAKNQCEHIANERDRIFTAEFQAGDNSIGAKEIEMDPYVVRIEPVSVNIPLRIELHAKNVPPYNTTLNASYAPQLNNDQLAISRTAAYCMEPIRTAIIAAPRSIAMPSLQSSVKPFDPVVKESRISRSEWAEPLPLPLPPLALEGDTDDERYDRCAFTCVKPEMKAQVKAICECSASQGQVPVLVSAENIKPFMVPVETLENQTLAESQSLSLMQRKLSLSQTEDITTPKLSHQLYLQNTQASQTSHTTQSSHHTQASQTSFPNESHETEIIPEHFLKTEKNTQSSQTSLTFDFEVSSHMTQHSIQLDELDTSPKRESIKESIQSEQSTELDVFPKEENIGEQSKVVEEVDTPLKEESIKESIDPIAPTQLDLLLKAENVKEEEIINETQDTQSTNNSMTQQSPVSVIKEQSPSLPQHKKSLSSLEDPSEKLQSLEKLSANDIVANNESSPVESALPAMKRQTNAETQTRRTAGSKLIKPMIKEETTQNTSNSVPKSQTVPPPPSKTYRIVLPQHKHIDTCAPCQYDPSPLMDENGRIFCPYNCGCCLCAWRVLPVKTQEEREKQEDGKLIICKCVEKGNLFTTFDDNERRCENTEPFDICPCREKAKAKFWELYEQDMWSDDEKLTILPDSREVVLSEVKKINRDS